MLCSILNYSSYTATFPCLGNVLHITSGINSFFFYKYIYICKSPYFIENGHFSPIYLFYYRSVSELQQIICLCLLAFVFRDTEQLRAAESKLMRWQHAYLPLFSTVSETPLGASAPWAALNTQQGLQPLPQSLIIFLTFFFWCLEEGFLPLMWETRGMHGGLPRDGPWASWGITSQV